MLSNKQIAKAADEAAFLIETEGWFRLGSGTVAVFPVEKSRKCYCPMTAFPHYGVDDVVRSFARYLGCPDSHSSSAFIIAWNDSQTSSEPVIAALRSFANEIRQKDSINA